MSQLCSSLTRTPIPCWKSALIVTIYFILVIEGSSSRIETTQTEWISWEIWFSRLQEKHRNDKNVIWKYNLFYKLSAEMIIFLLEWKLVLCLSCFEFSVRNCGVKNYLSRNYIHTYSHWSYNYVYAMAAVWWNLLNVAEILFICKHFLLMSRIF